MSDLASAVLDLARTEGVKCRRLVALRSTNNTVFLLTECTVVAKVHGSEAAAVRELAAGHALAARGAPIVAPAAGIGDHVRTAAGLHVTFWEYAADTDSGLSSNSVAAALCELHRHLLGLADWVGRRTFARRLLDAREALENLVFAPELDLADRRLLQQALDRAGHASRDWPAAVLHGSPHRMNIRAVDGAPAFIDLESIELGPLEWDLAHLEAEVAEAYPRSFDEGVLATCRAAVSAATATWCWGSLERGPDVRSHAEHHLAIVQAGN